MPVSKKRKKDGKAVKHKTYGRYVDNTPKPDPVGSAGLSLQDLIDMVAYQEYIKDGTIVADDVKVDMPDDIPLMIEGADGEKEQVGIASPIDGDPERMSIHIYDPEVAKTIAGPLGDLSIDKEN